jgi:hypothetical protein
VVGLAIEYSNDALKVFDRNLEDFVRDILEKDNEGNFINEDIIKILANFTDLEDSLDSNYNAYALLDKTLFTMPKPPAPVDDDKIRLIMSFLKADKAGSNNIFQFNINFFVDVWVFNAVESWYVIGHDGKRYSKHSYLNWLLNDLIMSSSIMAISGRPTLKQPPVTYNPSASANFMGYRSVYSIVN